MKKSILLFALIFMAIYVFPQKASYQDGAMGGDNFKILSRNSGYLHSFGSRYEGSKGSPNLFNSFVTSYILVKGQEKYIQFEGDIDLLRNNVIFMDQATGQVMEVPSDDVVELVFNKYDKELIYRTTKDINFSKKIRENKFYQVIYEKPYKLIMITFKTFKKADSSPTFNSGRHYDEFQTERRFYIEDSKGTFHHIILNKVDYDYIVHPTVIGKKELASIFPDKKEVIFKEFEEKPDSVSIERIYSILNKF